MYIWAIFQPAREKQVVDRKINMFLNTGIKKHSEENRISYDI
jgi:hypothetical protein